jgi:hypothetical protein
LYGQFYPLLHSQGFFIQLHYFMVLYNYRGIFVLNKEEKSFHDAWQLYGVSCMSYYYTQLIEH